ncbi:hypothetical protein B0H14DRAFT_3461602 [Mycena olivaceomarginata]|nr:hypothetical protein B0H14DRAFT_3461602 [Mycena olivaceomarginata]
MRPNTGIPQAFLVSLLFLTPALVPSLCPLAAPAFIWLVNTIPCAISVLYFIVLLFLGSLTQDVYKWFRIRTHSTFEDGHVAPPANVDLIPSSLGNTLTAKIQLSIAFALSASIMILTGDIVSLEHTLPDTLGAWHCSSSTSSRFFSMVKCRLEARR